MMLRSCKYCGKIHQRNYECPKKPPKKPRRYSPKNRQMKEKFRSTAAWQKARDAIVFRDMGVCQICLLSGSYNNTNLEVHHITSLAEDYTKRLDRLNLITLCAHHHKLADNGVIEARKLREIAERNEDNEGYEDRAAGQ